MTKLREMILYNINTFATYVFPDGHKMSDQCSLGEAIIKLIHFETHSGVLASGDKHNMLALLWYNRQFGKPA